MKFTTKEKTQTIDFILGMECFTYENPHLLDIKYKRIETIEYYQLHTEFLREITPYFMDFKKVFSHPFISMPQILYRRFYQDSDIENINDFISRLSQLTENDIRDSILYALDIHKETYEKNIEHIHHMEIEAELKYYILQVYTKPMQFIENTVKLIDKIYPIYLNYYEKALVIFENKINHIKQMKDEDIFFAATNFLGSDKLTKLQYSYKKIKRKTLEEVEKEYGEIEVALMMFGANRLANISKSNVKEEFFSKNPYSKSIYCLGLDSIYSNKKMKKAEQISKQILKTLSDDTRLDILRMIGVGLDTNKKLSAFFKVSPPAITYQTNILREAGIVGNKKDGTLYIIRENLDASLKKIQDLLSLSGKL